MDLALRGRVLAYDSRDAYNRYVRWFLYAAVPLWLASTFVFSSASYSRTPDGHVVSVSRDAGLQMTLNRPMDEALLSVHSVAGSVLLVLPLLGDHLRPADAG